MSKGFLYDNGDELIIRKDGSVPPPAEAGDAGKMVIVGSDGDFIYTNTLPIAVKVKVAGTTTQTTLTFYDVGGTAIKAIDILNLANSDGLIDALIVRSETEKQGYVARFHVSKGSEGWVTLSFPSITIPLKSGDDYYLIYVAPNVKSVADAAGDTTVSNTYVFTMTLNA